MAIIVVQKDSMFVRRKKSQMKKIKYHKSARVIIGLASHGKHTRTGHRTCKQVGEQKFHMYRDTMYAYHDNATQKNDA